MNNTNFEDHPCFPGHLRGWLAEHPPVLDPQPRSAVTDQTAGNELDRFRVKLGKYNPRKAGLPWAMRAQCPRCGKVVSAEFRKINTQVVLVFDCPTDGQIKQVHYDGIFSQQDSKLQTYSGSTIERQARLLPRTVETLCPQCSCLILGRFYVRDAAVWIEKTCPEHGYFRDCINRNVRLFARASFMSFDEPPGLFAPRVADSKLCPSDCGLCDRHQSPACLANIDLTNRCNLNCPVCFANSNAAGYVYEPTFDQVVTMMQRLRDYRPTPATCIQFSGGEPTLHPDFLKIVSKAAEMGFSNIQIATNGLKLAETNFASQAAKAGLHTLYLQFDGVDDQVYQKTRGRPLMELKRKCVENCRQFGMKICLVPTVIRGQTDHQVSKILQFAVDNVDVISGISYQPVSFTGRIDYKQLEAMRYTTGDLVEDIARASGADVYRDFYPLSFVTPFSQLLSAMTGAPKITSCCHTDCALGTYFFVSAEGKLHPFTRVFDIEPLFWQIHLLARKIQRRGKAGLLDKLHALWLFYKHFRRDQAPPELSFYRMVRSMRGMVNKRDGRGASGKTNCRTLMAAGMHFQDRYNFDVQRIRRCVIHYSTPEGIFPFCSYNCGPTYRPFVEKMHCRTTTGQTAQQADIDKQAAPADEVLQQVSAEPADQPASTR